MDSDDIHDSRTQRIPVSALAEIKRIPIICPWCNTMFRIEKWKVERNKRIGISHGICEKCAKKLLSRAKK
jgi:hypothetical protein